MQPIIVIPARLASTRLPNKPLADIAGVPMILRVWRQAMAAAAGPVVVAAAETEIAATIERAGGEAVLTDPDLASGTDRIFHALESYDSDGRFDIVVNLQGDLPDIEPLYIRRVVDILIASSSDIATLAAPIDEPAERDNPNVVKAVVAWDSNAVFGPALYFTRARAPFGEGALFQHIGIYAYRREALARFVGLAPSQLELREKLEQLRALEAGMTIAVARVERIPLSVDTAADLAKARAAIAKAEGSKHP
jgi:3-deoxy-manno-octulosonate cytidylyltransferase (CMP-KDO synthetase)